MGEWYVSIILDLNIRNCSLHTILGNFMQNFWSRSNILSVFQRKLEALPQITSIAKIPYQILFNIMHLSLDSRHLWEINSINFLQYLWKIFLEKHGTPLSESAFYDIIWLISTLHGILLYGSPSWIPWESNIKNSFTLLSPF